MNTQYKKGVVELCILCFLNKKDSYGYDVSEQLSKRIGLSDGAVYPILRKLKNDGLLNTYLSEESGGPPRKYYSITEYGREEFIKAEKEWVTFVNAVAEILKEERNDHENG